MDITKQLKDMMVGFFLSLNQADKEMLMNSGSAIAPENAITNPVYSQNSFLRGIQNGKLNEQQLKWFYSHLDGMDKFHRNGGALGPMLLNEGKSLSKDNEPGFEEKHVFQNRQANNSFGSGGKTLTVLRDDRKYGTANIEDYCHEVIIKQGYGGQLLAEFYCTNYKIGENSDLTERMYDNLKNNYTLQNFINIQAFNAVRSTATRNAIDHSYRIIGYNKLKQISNKEFVVKFNVAELT